MPTFPTITFARRAMYPLERTNRWQTKVLRFLNDQEQRFVQQLPKQEFVLTYTGVDASSYSTLKSFFESQQGASTNTFTLNLGTDPTTGVSLVYNNMAFVDDDFTATQSKPNLWTIKLHVRQIA